MRALIIAALAATSWFVADGLGSGSAEAAVACARGVRGAGCVATRPAAPVVVAPAPVVVAPRAGAVCRRYGIVGGVRRCVLY
ncbi:MAG: hypothetical protein U1E62_22205 [Alsobacter sp.]